MRKAQRRQRGVARAAVLLLAARPGEIGLAASDEVLAQRLGVERAGEHRLAAAADVEVDQRQLDLRPPVALAQQPAVDHRLRPVQRAVVGRLAGQRAGAAVGLDLLQPAAIGVEAVGAAAYPQLAVVPRQADLALVARAAPGGDGRMAFLPLERGRRGREAHVQVARLGGEGAQRADGDVHPALRSAIARAISPMRRSAARWASSQRPPTPRRMQWR